MDANQQVIEILQSIVTERAVSIEHLDQSLDEYALDSMVFVALVIALENQFHFEFDDDHLILSAFSTLRSLADYVSEHSNQSEVPS